MGQHDAVGVLDAPDDHTMAVFALTIGSQGNVTTETMRALSDGGVCMAPPPNPISWKVIPPAQR